MKFFPLLLLLFATPSYAITWKEFWEPFRDGNNYYYPTYPSRRYYPRESEICTKQVYREEYVPGNIYRPGYVRQWRDSYNVPCN